MAATLTGASSMVLFFLLGLVAATEAFDVPTLTFGEGFSHLFGNDNLIRSADDRSVRLTLNSYSGSGFISSDLYEHGFFSASIKLPKDYTAGVVVAFYTSNGDVFPDTHDELDFEFLGNVRGKDWRIQTNVYGNGSTTRGREERYLVPFDPTEEPHRYSILWTPDYIMYATSTSSPCPERPLPCMQVIHSLVDAASTSTTSPSEKSCGATPWAATSRRSRCRSTPPSGTAPPGPPPTAGSRSTTSTRRTCPSSPTSSSAAAASTPSS
ncbi:unnamed protein product, partial [Musa textilis]